MKSTANHPTSPVVALSVVAPAHNEEDNVETLIREIDAAMAPTGIDYEIVMVDDGSTDSTLSRLRAMRDESSRLRIVRMVGTPHGRGHGQSAAFHAAFRASRGELITILDADLQNDPADIPAMIEFLRSRNADMVQGDRSHARRDSIIRRHSSIISRWFRRALLGDTIRDTGCSLRILRREIALSLPLEFRGQHRFIPLTARLLGYTVVEMPVNHRPRVAGKAKYGVWNRALPGLIDCFAVRWMRARRRPVRFEIVEDTQDHEQMVVEVEPAAARSSPRETALT